jgi:DNA-directed RNA polymerase subunit RPC12/RpoP
MSGKLKSTGLVCPKCKQPVAIIDEKNPTMFRCPACGYEWTARVN